MALFSYKKSVGSRWGFSPQITHWLYTAVIRPILTYGVAVWWTALDKTTNRDKLGKVQRSASICVSGALRSTPSAALDILLNLTPLDILSKQLAASTAIRLKASHQWHNNSVGHSTILNYFSSIPCNTDYTIPKLVFNKKYSVIIPPRVSWSDRRLLENEAIHFYTDGSKTEEGVGGGVYSERLKVSLSFRLPNHCSVFQAEILAIKEVLSWLKENVISTRDIRIFSDSQAALKSLNSVSTNSITAHDCRSSLMDMAEQFNIHLIWVPGHRDIPGNCIADELARRGTTIPITPDKTNIGIPVATCKTMLKEDSVEKINRRWLNIPTCAATKNIWPSLNCKRKK